MRELQVVEYGLVSGGLDFSNYSLGAGLTLGAWLVTNAGRASPLYLAYKAGSLTGEMINKYTPLQTWIATQLDSSMDGDAE